MAASTSGSALRLLNVQHLSCEACTRVLAKRLQKASHAGARHVHRRAAGPSQPGCSPYGASPVSNAIASSGTGQAAVSRHHRHFHSSRRTAFTLFGYKKKEDDIEAMSRAFLEALEDKDVERLNQAYVSLRRTLLADSSIQASDFVSVEHMSKAMRLLSHTSYINEDYQTVRRMSQDLSTLWRREAVSAEEYSSYVNALVNSGRLNEAHRKLFSASSTHDSHTSGPVATPQDWNVYLRAYRDSRGNPYYATKSALETIPQTHRDAGTYVILLEALAQDASLESEQAASELQALLEHIDRLASDVEHQVERHTAVLNGFLSGVPSSEADKAYKQLEALLRDGQSWPRANTALVRYEILQARASKMKYDSVRHRSAALVEKFPATRQTLTVAILRDIMRERSACSLEAIREAISEVELVTSVLPDYTAYEHAMHMSESFADALALLRDSHRDGVSLSSGMLRAIVSKLPREGVNADEAETVKNIYGDLARSRLSDTRSRDGIHDVSLYIALLQYCARQDVADLAWATTLLEDLKAHGLSILNSEEVSLSTATLRQEEPRTLIASSSAASIVTSLMKHASKDHSQAFKAYSWMWAVDPDNIFSKQDWYDIIRTYADLSFTDDAGNTKASYVPSSVFFAFFEDMRKSGVPPDSPVYQAVLQYYAREGGSVKSSSAKAIRLIHDLIKMDHYYDPDIGLMNKLMYAYSNTGNLDSAVGVWRSILINNIPFDNTTISIIFHVYGCLGEFGKAAKLWESLKIRQSNEQVYELSKENLESFIEAACRTGNSTKAIEECFGALKWKDGALVDDKTLKILLKYTESDPQALRLLSQRLQKELPQYLPLVQDAAYPARPQGQSSDLQHSSGFSFSSLANRNRESAEKQANETSSDGVSFQKH